MLSKGCGHAAPAGCDRHHQGLHHGGGRRTVALPRELAYLAEYYAVADKAPFSTFHQYYHFGRSFDAIEAELAELQPDVVGISSLFTPYYREALEVAVRVKNRAPCQW